MNFVFHIASEMKIKWCDIRWPWRSPDKFTSASPLAGECGIKERCDPAVLIRRRTVLLEQDVCYLSVLLQLVYIEQFQHSSKCFLSEEEWFINLWNTQSAQLRAYGVKLECWATVVEQFVFQYVTRKKVASLLNFTLICGHGVFQWECKFWGPYHTHLG
jgi:hypothetical protein